jgi:hypothetical protein
VSVDLENRKDLSSDRSLIKISLMGPHIQVVKATNRLVKAYCRGSEFLHVMRSPKKF